MTNFVGEIQDDGNECSFAGTRILSAFAPHRISDDDVNCLIALV